MTTRAASVRLGPKGDGSAGTVEGRIQDHLGRYSTAGHSQGIVARLQPSGGLAARAQLP